MFGSRVACPACSMSRSRLPRKVKSASSRCIPEGILLFCACAELAKRGYRVLCANNGYIGYPVSKKIELPPNWEELLIITKRK